MQIESLAIGDVIENDGEEAVVFSVSGRSALLSNGQTISHCDDDQLTWSHTGERLTLFGVTEEAVKLFEEAMWPIALGAETEIKFLHHKHPMRITLMGKAFILIHAEEAVEGEYQVLIFNLEAFIGVFNGTLPGDEVDIVSLSAGSVAVYNKIPIIVCNDNIDHLGATISVYRPTQVLD